VIDALGHPQSMLVLGGSSDIALATAEAMAADRLRRVVLAGRDEAALQTAADRLRRAGVTDVTTAGFDAADPAGHAAVVEKAFADGDIDVVLLAFGVLGDQQVEERDPAAAVDAVTINYVGAVSAGLHVANALREQGHGVLVVLSSVAGVRARRANFVYGSAKAGLDAFAQGVDQALHGSGAKVLIVRPGFVHSKMTEGRASAPFATTPDVVAEAIRDGVRKGAAVVWVPRPLQLVMTVVRLLPRAVFRRLPG
jgi:decaprenylphospho-beta-D-erythro-pentofuranosid-2-ulose 2-reductase